MHPFTPNNLSSDTNPVEASALTILELLPLLGPTLSKMYSNYALDTRLQRLENFINEVFKSMNTNQLEVNNKLNTLDEYHKLLITSLVQKTFNAVQDEIFYEEKKEYFKNCFLNFIANPPLIEEEHDLAAHWIECLKQMSLTEIKVLYYSYLLLIKLQTEENQYFKTTDITAQSQLSILSTQAAISKLVSLGFLDSAATWDGGFNYKLSQLGQEFRLYCLNN